MCYTLLFFSRTIDLPSLVYVAKGFLFFRLLGVRGASKAAHLFANTTVDYTIQCKAPCFVTISYSFHSIYYGTFELKVKLILKFIEANKNDVITQVLGGTYYWSQGVCILNSYPVLLGQIKSRVMIRGNRICDVQHHWEVEPCFGPNLFNIPPIKLWQYYYTQRQTTIWPQREDIVSFQCNRREHDLPKLHLLNNSNLKQCW